MLGIPPGGGGGLEEVALEGSGIIRKGAGSADFVPFPRVPEQVALVYKEFTQNSDKSSARTRYEEV